MADFGKHLKVMSELQTEWKKNEANQHLNQRKCPSGISSSQISALVGLLINKGILKPDE